MDKLSDVINKISTQLEEVHISVNEIKETLQKQRNEDLLKRLTSLENSMKDQHIKLDALNAIDINPTIIAPTAPVTVRVAATKAKKQDAIEDDDTDTDSKIEENKTEDPKQFSNITEYFKHLWVAEREMLYAKGVVTEEEYMKIYNDNKEKFDKKKKNELVLQKAVAFQIWKSLPTNRKDIVYAMKNQSSKDEQKRNSTEINEEDEDN